MNITDTPTLIAQKSSWETAFVNTGEVTIYLARTAAEANDSEGFPLEAGQGGSDRGPLYAATAEGTSSTVATLRPGEDA